MWQQIEKPLYVRSVNKFTQALLILHQPDSCGSWHVVCKHPHSHPGGESKFQWTYRTAWGLFELAKRHQLIHLNISLNTGVRKIVNIWHGFEIFYILAPLGICISAHYRTLHYAIWSEERWTQLDTGIYKFTCINICTVVQSCKVVHYCIIVHSCTLRKIVKLCTFGWLCQPIKLYTVALLNTFIQIFTIGNNLGPSGMFSETDQ